MSGGYWALESFPSLLGSEVCCSSTMFAKDSIEITDIIVLPVRSNLRNNPEISQHGRLWHVI